jgi:hypothetical protein
MVWPNHLKPECMRLREPPAWASLSETFPNSGLFGSKNAPNPHGINQGALGDCYFLAALSAVAEDTGYYKSSWVT